MNFSLQELFNINSLCLTPLRAPSLNTFKRAGVEDLFVDETTLDMENLRIKHRLGSDSRNWVIGCEADDLKEKVDGRLSQVTYRPFDFRGTPDKNREKRFFSYHRRAIMRHFRVSDNIGLVATGYNRQKSLGYAWISKSIVAKNVLDSTGHSTSFFPLYLYPESQAGQTMGFECERVANLNSCIVEKMARKLNYVFIEDDYIMCDISEGYSGTLYPLDILDYIYAVLHSPGYREKHKASLKIDFPRIPYPKERETFGELAELGGELRQIHLLESPVIDTPITSYPIAGNNLVEKVRFEGYLYYETLPNEDGTIDYPDYLGTVYINPSQYFADVPTSAWDLYIGGYRPAQKWLRDRKGSTLKLEDIQHYQKMIVSLTETVRLMREIDKIEIE